jgi:precorrin-6B methylase 2
VDLAGDALRASKGLGHLDEAGDIARGLDNALLKHAADLDNARAIRNADDVVLSRRLDHLDQAKEGGHPLRAIEIGPGEGFDTIQFAKAHPELNITAIEYDPGAVRRANRLLESFPDVQHKVKFVSGDATKIDLSEVNAPASLVYNLFPSGASDEIAELGGATARFVSEGGEIRVLTELTDKALLNTPAKLESRITNILKQRGLQIEGTPIQKIINLSDLRTGKWDFGFSLISMQANTKNTLFIFKIGKIK